MRRTGEVSEPVGCGHSDHLCWVYDDRRQWCSAAVAYLRDGAEAGEQLVYVSHRYGTLLGDLAGLPGLYAMVATGQLRVVAAEAWFAEGSGGFKPPAGSGGALWNAAASAQRSGFEGIRLAVDATSVAASEDGVRRMMTAELLADAAIAHAPWSAICGYDRTRVPEPALDALRLVHPLRQPGARQAALYATGPRQWRLTGAIGPAETAALAVALAAVDTSGDVEFHLGGLDSIDVDAVALLAALAARLDPGRRVLVHEAPAAVAAYPGASIVIRSTRSPR